jgi:dipeptidase E
VRISLCRQGAMHNSGDIILCSSEQAVANAIKDLPKPSTVAFVRTASKVCSDIGWLEAERAILVDAGFYVTDVFDLNASTRSLLERSDVIFLGGGNTFILLSEMRRSGLDVFLIQMHQAGKILIGESAGALVLGPTIDPIRFIDEPEKAPDLTDFRGLGLFDFFPAVHFGRAEFQDQYPSIVLSAFTMNLSPRFLPKISLSDRALATCCTICRTK